MELLLNILWLLIAVGLLWAWRTRWVHQRRRSHRHSLREWSAVSLALVLLFFAVSMSDDMHSEIVALEECSTSRRDLVCSANAHALPQSGAALHTPSWAIVRPAPFYDLSCSRRELELATQVRLSIPQNSQPSGRAPPVSSL